MDQIGEPAQSQKLEGFKYLTIVTQAFGILLVILVATWNVCYRGGFAWSSNPSLQFNWHPMLMTVGLVFLYANGKNSILANKILEKLSSLNKSNNNFLTILF